MPISLKAATEEDRKVLDFLERDFLKEAGFFLGIDKSRERNSVVPGFGDLDSEHAARFLIQDGTGTLGFLDVAMDEAGAVWLSAIFVQPPHRGRGIGSAAIEQALQANPGRWSVRFPLRLQSATSFFEKIMLRVGGGATVSSDEKHADLGVFRTMRFESVSPFSPMPSQSHHTHRRKVLLWGAIGFPLVGLVAVEMDWAPLFLLCSVASFLFFLWYLEIVVTGIFDRQDRGPLVTTSVRVEDE